MVSRSRLKKTGLVITSILVFLFIIIVACISPIAKYLVEKYDLTFTGREITVESSYVNPFTGYVRFGGVKIYENHSDSVFISANSLSGNFAMLKLLAKTYEIADLTLDGSKVYVIQNQKEFNFSDVIEFYTPKKPRRAGRKPVHLNLLNMKISNSMFFYNEKTIPVSYSVKTVNMESPGLKWDVDSIDVKFSFYSGNGLGNIKGDMVIDKNTGDYTFTGIAQKYDLRFLEQYLKDLSNYGKFRANLDASIKASGNFKGAENINCKGLIAINDFHLSKKINEDYASFKKFTLQIEELNPRSKKYLFDSVSLYQPFFKYERYDHLNNIEMMFGEKGKVAADHSEFNIIIEIGKYIEELARNFFKSDYKINRLAIYKGACNYNDYSLNEKFSVSADPIYFIADSIKRDNKPVGFTFKTGIKPYGTASVFLSINPKDSSDFDVVYNFDQIPVTLFNPYLIAYTSFPLDRGTIELRGKWKVRNGNIESNNHLIIIDPRVHKRLANMSNKWIPLRLVTFFVRERGNVIDYEIPITGNLKKPKFHFRDVVLDGLRNTVVKPLSAPYITDVRSTENEIERSLTLNWEMRQSSLSSKQDHFLKQLSGFLIENPSVSLSVNQSFYGEKEKEYILLYETKKRYYLQSIKKNEARLTEEDETTIEKMSIKDSLFVRYLDRNVKKELLFTIQDKCLEVLGEAYVNDKLNKLITDREALFLNHFRERQISDRVKLKAYEDGIPYSGFSFYKINYKGDIPEELKEAFENMKDLDNESPRKKFKKDRERRRMLVHAKKKQ